jgi:SAM-dependent methyltransferase
MYIKSIANELQDYLDAHDLYEETSFSLRGKALEAIRILKEVAARQAGVLEEAGLTEILTRANELESSILACNREIYSKYLTLFQTSRQDRAMIRKELNRFTSYQEKTDDVHHYMTDDLDILFDGVLNYDLDTLRLPKRSSEFHHLERTPARVLLDLIDHLPLSEDDVLYDLGAGLGHVVILINLLCGIRCVGIEIEPMYCELANENIRKLGLAQVTVLTQNILESTFDDGTVFFFYSPFHGSVLDQVLEKLRQVAAKKPITLVTFGPITLEIAKTDWIQVQDEKMLDAFKLAIFRSVK